MIFSPKTSLAWLIAAATSVSARSWSIETDANKVSQAATKTPNFVPGRFIIEFEDSSFTKRDGSSILSVLSSSGIEAELSNQFDSDVFQGASVNIDTSGANTVEELRKISGVKNAWQASYVVLDDEMNPASSPVWNPHSITGVEDLHERGISGEGITIAVVDTGVDYTHPALGGGIGPEFPVIGGYDFSEDPSNPSSDPMDCAGHGTFVSSVIVGNSDLLTGVAPDAKIRMYKVFECSGTTSDDIVIAGLLKAYEDRPDVISLSLGADRGYNSHPMAVVAAKIAKEITILFAAGNSGESGPFTASNGGSGKDVLSVGSTNAVQMLGYEAVAVSSSGETKTFGYIGNNGDRLAKAGTFKVRVDDSNACIGSSSSDDRTLLIARRGTCYIGSLTNGLSARGWESALLFPSATQDLTYFAAPILATDQLQNLGQITYEFAQWAIEETKAGNTIEIVISNNSNTAVFKDTNIKAGQMSSFSSWGPTFENDFYPSISAPGGAVFGCAIGGGYSVGSGTSFACPYAAGLAALYLAHFPDASPETLRTDMMSTAKDLFLYKSIYTGNGLDTSTIDTSKNAPLIQAGAGLIDAVKMFDQGTKVTSKAYLELNDTINRVEAFEITIVNTNTIEVTYSIEHTPGTTINSRDTERAVWEYFPPAGDSVASAVLSQSSLTLASGESATVNVRIQVPSDADELIAPIYSGKIWFTGDNGDSVHVPYMGVQANSYAWGSYQYSPVIIGYDSDEGYYYNVTEPELIRAYKPDELDSPRIWFNHIYGSEYTSFDIVDADYDISTYVFPPVAGENGYLGPIMSTPDVYGNVGTWPYEFVTRVNPVFEQGFQGFANGTKIPTGHYRILARALRTFGSKDNLEDWDIMVTDDFYVNELSNQSSSSSLSSSTVSSSDSSSSSASASLSESSSISSAGSSASISSSESSGYSSSSSVSPSSSSGAPESDRTIPSVKPVVTGSDFIKDISIVGKVTSGPELFKRDWITISVTFESKLPIPEGTITQFAIPGFAATVSGGLSTTWGNGVASLEFDGEIGTVTWGEWPSWNENIEGTVVFDVRLAAEVADSINKPEIINFISYSPEKEFTNILNFYAQPDDKPVRNSFYLDGNPVWIVDIPSTLGPWESISLEGYAAAYDFTFDCSAVTKSIGSELDVFRNATQFRDATDFETEICSEGEISYKYSSSLENGELLRIYIPSERQSSIDGYFEQTMAVTVVKTDGSSKIFYLNDEIRKSPKTEFSVFSGQRYTPPSTTSESSFSSVVSSSAPTATRTIPSESPSVTGVDIVTDISIANKISTGADSFKSDWFTVSVSFFSKDPLEEGAITQFAIPGFEIDGSAFYGFQTTSSMSVASVEFDGDTVTVSWDQWTTWNMNLEGTVTFDVRLANDVIESITKPESIVFNAYSPEREFSSQLDFVALPETAPVRNSFFNTNGDPSWIISIPGTLGPWESIDITGLAATYDFTFDCGSVVKSVGSKLDEFRNATTLTDAVFEVDTCNLGEISYRFTSSIEKNEVLRVYISSERQSSFSYFDQTMSVVITKEGGSSEAFYFTDPVRTYGESVFNTFTGERYVPPSVSSASEAGSSDSDRSSSASWSASVESSESSVTFSEDENSSSIESSIISVESSSAPVESSEESDASSFSESDQNTGVSSSSTVSASAVPTGPILKGSFINGNPVWDIEVPSFFGPWANVAFNASADANFLFNDIKYTSGGKTYPVNSTLVRSVEFDTGLFDEETGLGAHFGGRYFSGESFTIKIRVEVTRPDEGRIVKRDVLVFELEDTISPFAESSSTVESESSLETSSSSVESESSIETSSSSVESESSIETSSSVESESSIETSSSVESESSIETSSSVESESSIETSSSVESESSIETSSSVESESSIETSSSVESESSIETSSSSVESEDSIETSSSSAESESSIDTSSDGGSVSGSSEVPTGTDLSSQSSTKSASQFSNSAVSSTMIESTGSSTSAEIRTISNIGTTVLTITSCEEDRCHKTAITTGLSVVTATISGQVTEYTTYCPITQNEWTTNTLKTAEAVNNSKAVKTAGNTDSAKATKINDEIKATKTVDGLKTTTATDTGVPAVGAVDINNGYISLSKATIPVVQTEITVPSVHGQSTSTITEFVTSKATPTVLSSSPAVTTFTGAANRVVNVLAALALPLMMI